MFWYWQKIIPRKFHRNSGLINYESLIINPSSIVYNYMFTLRGNVKKITNSAYCETFIYNKRFYLLVPKSKDTNLYQAIILLGKTSCTGDRINRYLNLYKSYECLCSQPDPILKAIRDGLSHPSSVLSNKNTKLNLISVFGETLIDLDNFRHQRLFFTHLGRLLIENDKLIHNRIKVGLSNFHHLKNQYDAINDWQIKKI